MDRAKRTTRRGRSTPRGGRQLLIAGQVAGMSWPDRCP